MTPEEKILVEGCIAGDRAAQFKLFDKYSAWGHAICRRYARDEEMAKEMLQNGFLRILKKIDQYDSSRGELKAWMSRVIVNTSLSYLRLNSSKYTFVELDHASESQLAVEDFYSFSTDDLLKFIAKMPDGYRTVFNLNVIDGYSHKEIAEKLGINEATSRSQLARAKKWINNTLTNKIHSLI